MTGKLIVFISFCITFVVSRDFICNDIPNQVEVYGSVLTCPANTICNLNLKLINRETKPRPCLPSSEICSYTCNTADPTIVTAEGTNFNCESGQVCNEKKTSCNVCICRRDIFKCENATTAIMLPSNYPINCPTGEICNADFIAPCQPCIKDPDTNTTEEPTEPPTDAPNEPTTDAPIIP